MAENTISTMIQLMCAKNVMSVLKKKNIILNKLVKIANY